MAQRVSVNLRSVLARFLQSEPLHDPANSFELKETVAFCESELRFTGIGTERLPPWSTPFQTLPIEDTWRFRRAAEAGAWLVNGARKIERQLMSDEKTFYRMAEDCLTRAGYVDPYKIKFGQVETWTRKPRIFTARRSSEAA